VTAGERFDNSVHRPVGAEKVTDPALDGTVAEVCSDGFRRGEQTVRRADVRVAKYKES